ncbi:MAG: rhomboid family intramembrane serine protease [Betaproteobacteria bacterium]|nr:rhomboid family intramembrane serine protease [Betaproteobacteria bacterium]
MSGLPPVTQALLILNAAMFAGQMLAGDGFTLNLALWPVGTPSVFGGHLGFQPWQIVTYSFVHGSLLHLFVNMFALYMFGSELERVFGRKRYVNLYFASVIAAAASQLVVQAYLGGAPYPTVGASGGVFGLLLGYAIYFPNRMVMLIFPPIPMRARVFVILYGTLELYLGVTGTQSGVAHFAHLGGMLGAWLIIQNWRGRWPFRKR